MNFLILGGTGTISYGIAEEALRKGHRVSLINRGNRKYRVLHDAETISADINDEERVSEFLSNRIFDFVIDPLVFNLASLQRHIALFGPHCKSFVFISSCCAFGSSDDLLAIDETHTKNPKSKYAVEKWECERFLESNSLNFSYTIIRPYITYGDIRIPIPFACRNNPYTILDRIKKDKPLVCFAFSGEHRTCHNLMDIEDFSRVVVSLLESPESVNNDFNVCSENVYSWEEPYGILYDQLGKRPMVYEIDRKYFARLDDHLYEDIVYDKDCRGTVYSAKKARSATNSVQKEKSLEDGIQKIVDYLENTLKDQPLEERFNQWTDMLLLFGVHDKDENLKKYISNMSPQYRLSLIYSWYRLSVLKHGRNAKNRLKRYSAVMSVYKRIRKQAGVIHSGK